MFSIIVAVLFAIRIYSNSVHCLPKYSVSVKRLSNLVLNTDMLGS